MQVTAKLNSLRISPRKVRLVANLIKGLDSQEVLNQLSYLNKGCAKDLLKLVNSAIANGENNYGLQKNNLFIKECSVNEGMILKRWRPRAQGRAAKIRKRSSNITLVLDERVPTPVEKAGKQSASAKESKSSKKEPVNPLSSKTTEDRKETIEKKK